MSQKIPCAIFRWIEYELYNLEEHKEELKRLKEEILLHSPDRLGGGGKANTISDQTGNKAVKLAANPRIENLKNKIKVIEEVLKRRPVFREIYEYKYRRCCTIKECCKTIGIDGEKIFKILREALIIQIAQGLGEHWKK